MTDERRFPRGGVRRLKWLALAAIIFLVLLGITLGPITPRTHGGPGVAYLQDAHIINSGMRAYADAHGGKFPVGKSSTEVFQQLLDQDFVDDPKCFYIPRDGKTAPATGQKLKPENVCFDFTAGADGTSPDWLPLVYMSGYRITFEPRGTAVPLIKPFPPYLAWRRNWYDIQAPFDLLVMSYKQGRCVVLLPGADCSKVGGVANELPPPDATKPRVVIPAGFDAKGQTYRQLTPDGPLP